jgi:hypothetical protein
MLEKYCARTKYIQIFFFENLSFKCICLLSEYETNNTIKILLVD